MKVSDYIFKYLMGQEIRDVFMISGGGAMHLVDSVGSNRNLKYYCPHHEQAAAIAAEGYARVAGKMGVVVVTSGPGGTNTLTGVIGQWLDSVPVLYLSGQVKQETTIASCRELGLRQLGDQEINITDIVKPVTKYAAIILEPAKILWHLEKAVYLATHGRPGPVWLDIPLDVQAAMIDETKLISYNPHEDGMKSVKNNLSGQIKQVLELLKKAERPVLLAGHGIRIAGAQKVFREFVERTGIPVLTTFNGYDLVPSDYPLYAGRPGTVGTRFGNFTLQNADALLSVGSRNNIRQISYNWQNYARGAKKIIIDIDTTELKKPTIKADIPVEADAQEFFEELLRQLSETKLPEWKKWLAWCLERKNKYPVVQPEYWEKQERINPYAFVDTLTKALPAGATVVAGNGTACVALFQAGVVKDQQRIFWNSGCASMGYDLPAAIGACVGNGKKPVVCLAGDGSVQMNIQELQTLVTYGLPVKLFVLNNNGYISIRQTQDNFFAGRYVACDPSSGVCFPNILAVAEAYGLPTMLLNNQDDMKEQIAKVIAAPGPMVCEVLLSTTQKFSPRVASEKKPDGRMVSKPLEDMYPFLPREEFKKNMIIEPLKEE
ncbi:MAG: thiamine pyrophosphate-binding protein [Elusimicrobia bacterium]|nr:thiamine pyrophosphate-binding protein [Elusimicrobiota bacterium]